MLESILEKVATLKDRIATLKEVSNLDFNQIIEKSLEISAEDAVINIISNLTFLLNNDKHIYNTETYVYVLQKKPEDKYECSSYTLDTICSNINKILKTIETKEFTIKILKITDYCSNIPYSELYNNTLSLDNRICNELQADGLFIKYVNNEAGGGSVQWETIVPLVTVAVNIEVEVTINH